MLILQIIIYMKQILLLLSLLLLTSSQLITANLDLIQYEPHLFQLTFSQSVDRPMFQLMLNNIYEIEYHFTTNQLHSDIYFMQVDSYSSTNIDNLQNYGLIFNNPLSVGNGRLQIESFTLTSAKKMMQITFPPALGIIMVVAAYLLINFTSLGNTIVEFLQIYCLLMFKNGMKTKMYHEIGTGMLLLNSTISDGFNSPLTIFYIVMILPFFLILGAGILGLLLKKFYTKQKSVVCNIFYEMANYNLFVNISIIFIFPLFFNSIQFIIMAKTNQIQAHSTQLIIGSFFAYFNLLTVLFVLYLFVYMINPKPNQTDQSWSKYLKSSQFDSFRKLSQGLVLTSWLRRNKNLIIILKRLLICSLFFITDSFDYLILLIQFFNIFYIFTVRPYKSQIYMNISVICRLMMFVFYILVVLGNLYFSLGPITINYESARKYLIARNSVFITIVLLIYGFLIYQLFLKCSNLNYEIKLVRDQNQLRLQITEKEKEAEEKSQRKHLISFAESDQFEKRQTKFAFPDLEPKRQSTGSKNKAKHTIQNNTLSPNILTNSLKDDRQNRRKTRMEFQMMDFVNEETKSRRNSNVSSRSNKTKRDKKAKQKWKKQSLLAQILKQH